jgi:hypothetical protein
MAIEEFDKQAKAMRGLLGDIGVEDEDYKRAAMAKRLAEASQSTTPSIDLKPPRHYTTEMREEMGTGKFLGQAFFGEMHGPLGAMFAPEYAARKALYGEEVKTYAKQKADIGRSSLADPFRAMLQNQTTEDDLQALEQLAVLYPEVYGSVLRDFQKDRLVPDRPTYTEGKWQLDPNYDNGEGLPKGRYYLERQGSDGSDKKVYGQPGFVPKSFMPGAEYLDAAIGKEQEQAYVHQGNAQGARNVLDQMELVGPDNWTAGYAAKGGEFIKSVFGREDFVTGIRKEYQDIKVRNAISNLPPGVASDKDIELALSPWPEDTSNYALIVAKLEAIERIENARYEYRTFSGSYIEANRGRSGLQSSWNETATAKRVASDNERDSRAVGNKDVEEILQNLGIK